MKVVITKLDILHPKEKVYEEVTKRSRMLIDAICQFSKELRKRDVEIFERHVNILRTSEGYYCAVDEKDFNKNRTNPPEEKIKPFKGIDGRMKISMKDKNGDDRIEDLATLVAMTFIDNPEGYKYVRFKDNNPENVKQENLYWSEY